MDSVLEAKVREAELEIGRRAREAASYPLAQPTRIKGLCEQLREKAATPEPSPTPGGMPVVPALVEYILARRDYGKRKYGTELHTDNGRDPKVDALQEALDLAQYLMQDLMQQQAVIEKLGSDNSAWAKRCKEAELVVANQQRRLDTLNRDLASLRGELEEAQRVIETQRWQLQQIPVPDPDEPAAGDVVVTEVARG